MRVGARLAQCYFQRSSAKDMHKQMREAATNLEFEKAARLRDEVERLREMEVDVLEGSTDA
jgi:excinuclease ABC subunit B